MDRIQVIIRSSWPMHRPDQPEGVPTYYLGTLDEQTGEVEVMRRLMSDEELAKERHRLAEAREPNPKGPSLATASKARTETAAARHGPGMFTK